MYVSALVPSIITAGISVLGALVATYGGVGSNTARLASIASLASISLVWLAYSVHLLSVVEALACR